MMHKLYILMRTDMASMTPGRMCAMASHASNQFVKDVENRGPVYVKNALAEWENETPYGFGTCIVLNGGDLNEIEDFIGMLNKYYRDYYFSNIVIDPIYNIRDGHAVLTVPDVTTCAYVFAYNNQTDELQDLPLL